LPVVLYGCENLVADFAGGKKLRVYDNMVLRRIFGPTRDDGNGGIEEIA